MRSSFLIVVLALALPSAASAQVPSRNVDLLAHLNDYGTVGVGEQHYSACWGYVHPDGREYAILGTWDGTAIYNVTVPTAPYLVKFIPGPQSLWRESKAYRNWIYIVTEGEGTGQGVQIVRMTDPENPVLAATYTTGFSHSHTVACDTARALLICNGTRDVAGLQTGMRILSIADPESPVELATWPPGVYPVPVDQYVHDCAPVGDRLYASSIYGGRERIFDFSDPRAPVEVSSWPTPGAFTHSSWPDASGRYVYVTDERTGFQLAIYDIQQPTAPNLVFEYTPNPVAIVHNAHVMGDELYLSSYTEGIEVLDLADPAHPAMFAYADSYPGPSGGFNGVWEVFPYFPSGTVIASDRQSGLYVYRVRRDYGLLRAQVVVSGGPGPTSVGAACGLGGACCCAPRPCTCAHHAGGGAAGLSVFLDGNRDSLVTGPAGVAVFAPDPGPHTVKVKTFGYTEAEATRTVAVGTRDTVELAIQLKPTADFTGNVLAAGTLAPLADAEVHLAYTTLHQHTNPLGQFALLGVPNDDYLVQVQRPGYVPVDYVRHIGPGYGGQDFRLIPAPFYDPLESETGWTVGATGDDAITGQWIRVEPIGTGLPLRVAPGPAQARIGRAAAEPAGVLAATSASGTAIIKPGPTPLHEGHEGDGAVPGTIQPETDRTPEGTMCFVTGNGANPNNPDQQDLDVGHTTLTSPAIDLTGLAIPAVAYWRWFYASPPDPMDYLLVELSNDNGQSWVPVDTTRDVFNHWQQREIRVTDFLAPTAQMKLRFVAQDLGDALTIVEAGIDDVIGFDAATTPVGLPPTGPSARLRFRPPWPNPARGAVRFALELPAPAALAVDVIDVQGRIVRTLHDGAALAGIVNLSWDGGDTRGNGTASGLYFVRARGGGAETWARFVRVP